MTEPFRVGLWLEQKELAPGCWRHRYLVADGIWSEWMDGRFKESAPKLPEGTSMLDAMQSLEEMGRELAANGWEAQLDLRNAENLGQALLWAIDRIRQLEDQIEYAKLYSLGIAPGLTHLWKGEPFVVQPNPLHPEDCRWCHPKP